MRRAVMILVLGLAVCAALTGCGNQEDTATDGNQAVRESAQAVADAFTDSDMGEINEKVFGVDSRAVEDTLLDEWDKESQSQEGVLAIVFELATVKVGDVGDDSVVFEVTAPDMSKVFDGLGAESSADMSEEELLEYVSDYARDAETREAKVTLEYSTAGGEPTVNYQDEGFVNAVTGGLLDAYKALYAQVLDEYAKGLE